MFPLVLLLLQKAGLRLVSSLTVPCKHKPCAWQYEIFPFNADSCYITPLYYTIPLLGWDFARTIQSVEPDVEKVLTGVQVEGEILIVLMLKASSL